MPTYISAEGLEDLKREYEHRKNIVRKEISERISSAKELGDLSENFEYHEAKEQQALNESRIVQLESMIQDAVLVAQKSGELTISLGVTFDVESNGTKRTFELVGSSEADPLKGKISNESPLGQAFFGQSVGDIVTIKTPSGPIDYRILDIH